MSVEGQKDMTALPSDLLVSRCHEAIVYLDDAGNNRCSACLAICETAGTLGELYERKKAGREQQDSAGKE